MDHQAPPSTTTDVPPATTSPGGVGRLRAALRVALRPGGRTGVPRRNTEGLVKWTTRVASFIPGLALVGLVVGLLVEAWPAIKVNGIGFLTTSGWEPGGAYAQPVTTHGVLHPAGVHYGALPIIVGTLESSALALLIAVPVAFGTALIVVHKLPRRLSSFIGMCLEVLAGIPSVIYGLWGALTLGPFLAHHVSPFVANHLPDVTPFRYLKGPVGSGEGLLTGGVVLAIMVVPIVASTSRDLLRQVPRGAQEGAVALGMTDAEVVRTVSIPWVRTGVIGASILGLGRALGETIALAMISGLALGTVPSNIYQTFSSIAATIVSQLDSSFTDGTGFATHTYAELGAVLVVMTLLANVGARLLVRRSSTTALPVGRGI